MMHATMRPAMYRAGSRPSCAYDRLKSACKHATQSTEAPRHRCCCREGPGLSPHPCEAEQVLPGGAVVTRRLDRATMGVGTLL